MASPDTWTPRFRLRLDDQDLAAVRRWAAGAYPNEACGLLIGAAGAEGLRVVEVREARNVEPDRTTDRYTLDPGAVHAADRDARSSGLDILGFWHSHPDSPAIPSQTDRTRAWGGYAYVIVSVRTGRVGEIRAWTLEDGAFQEGRIVS